MYAGLHDFHPSLWAHCLGAVGNKSEAVRQVLDKIKSNVPKCGCWKCVQMAAQMEDGATTEKTATGKTETNTKNVKTACADADNDTAIVPYIPSPDSCKASNFWEDTMKDLHSIADLGPDQAYIINILFAYLCMWTGLYIFVHAVSII